MPDLILTYGVWLPGMGWLKRDGTDPVPMRTFASTSREVAESAAALWGKGARVYPFDGSLIDFEPVFLKRQSGRGFRWQLWPTTTRPTTTSR